VCLLRSGDTQIQEDATLIINNCAAFCEDVCPAIVACPGMLDVLKALITNGTNGAKYVAVGAINCLSRCAAARDQLLASRVVETALVPVLKKKGAGDKHEAHVARATMAIANLKGESWAGIHFAPYSVMFPLHNLTCRSSEADKLHLVQSGLAIHLTDLIAQWKLVLHQRHKTLTLALQMSKSLCVSQETMRTMRDQGLVQVRSNQWTGGGGMWAEEREEEEEGSRGQA
jgi:hypothetical protein